MRLFFLFIFNFFFTILAVAQGNLLKGSISDSNGMAIPYATVQLLTQNEQLVDGAISVEDGSFVLHYPDSFQLGDLLVKISSMGYKPYQTSLSSDNLRRIVLEEDVKSVGEVTIVGKKPVYKLENGNITTSIKNTFLSNIGKATDVFKYLPGIWGEGNSITVLGKGKPVFYINNRRIRNQSELTMLKSDNIDNIEIVYNPGSEYDSDVQAVVKIKTISKLKESLSGEAEVGTIWSDGWKYGGNGSLSYHSQKGFDCFGNVEYMDGVMAKSTLFSTMKAFTKQPWITHSEGKSEQKGHDVSAKVGLSQQFAGHHSAGIQYMYTGNQLNNFVNMQAYSQMNAEILDKIQSDNRRKKQGNNHYLNTYYTGDFNGHWSGDFNLDIVKNTIHTLLANTESSEMNDSRKVVSDAPVDNYLYAGRLSTSYRQGIHNLVGGLAYTDIRSHSVYQEENNIISQSDTETKEATAALFVSYRMKYRKFALQAGMRYEHTVNKYEDFLNSDKNQKKKYDFFLPNIAFSFPVAHAAMSFSYSQTIQRPSFHDLDGSLWYIDRFLVSQGNPQLTSAVKHDLTWQVVYKAFRFSSTYINQKNPIFRTQKIYNEAASVVLESYENMDKYQSLNLTASYNPTIKFWNPMLNVSLEQPFFQLDTYNGMRKFNNPIFFVACNNVFRCFSTCLVRLNFDFASAGNTSNEHRMNNRGGVDVNIQQSLCKDKFLVRLAVWDVFNTRSKYESEKYNIAVLEYTSQKDYRRSIILSFTYRFNYHPSRYKGSMNSEINRLK